MNRPPICRRTLEWKRRNTTSSTATELQPAILLPRIPILHVLAVEDGSDRSNGMSTVHSALYNCHDPYLHSDSVLVSHNKHARYITRSTKNTVFDFTSDPIFYNQPHLQKTLQSIKFSAAALWNKLPLTLNQLINVTTSKSQLKAWLMKDYISSRETITTDIT